MTPLATVPALDCWNTIGVRGDRSCPELEKVVHCQNCPVFADAGRRFLDAPSPPGYLDEWTQRLAVPVEEEADELVGVLIFRLADECLALSVQVLVEVTPQRPVQRIPYQSGLLAGLVNIRGELSLCVQLSKLLGMEAAALPKAGPPPITSARGAKPASSGTRFLVVRRDGDRWVFPVDAVDQVYRLSRRDLETPPPTVGRAAAHLTAGTFSWKGQTVGLLDDARLFEALRAKLR